MVELGTRCTTERVHVGHSPPTVARACALLDHIDAHDVNILVHGTRLLWLNDCDYFVTILAHESRSA